MTEEMNDRGFPTSETKRRISPGLERWMGTEIPCLNAGFVCLIDYMEPEFAAIEAARVSYSAGTTWTSTEQGLLRYLRRHDHTTPFEMGELKFHLRMPMFLGEQVLRHRMASINKMSGRYSIMPEDMYIPALSDIAEPSTANRQGRQSEPMSEEFAQEFLEDLGWLHGRSLEIYQKWLNDRGDRKHTKVDPERPQLARELARGVLIAFVYTEFYWKLDTHNLMHFLRLRMDPTAQREVQIYGEAIGRVLKDGAPWLWEAFVDYHLQAMRFSRVELEVIKRAGWVLDDATFRGLCAEAGIPQLSSGREGGEQQEFRAKLDLLGLLESAA